MNRSTTNLIRFFLDECLPPIIRDSKWFMFPFYWIGYRGKQIEQAMNFKRRVVSMSPEEYAHFYQTIDTISRHRETDLNAKCVSAILAALPNRPLKILDAGCGNGFLLRTMAQRYPKAELYGLDLKAPAQDFAGTFALGSVEAIPFPDEFFDLVICSHTLEHCLHLPQVVSELKRVAGDQLIIVVPKQRPYFYTVDEHVQFFFYQEQLTSVIDLKHFNCVDLNGDWFYHGWLKGSQLKKVE